MGACCSRKKKSSSKSTRRTGDYEKRKEECESREEEYERRDEKYKIKEEAQNGKLRRKGIFHHLNKNRRYVEEAGDAEKDIGLRNNSYNDEVCRHNFLEYKLRAVKKKYESKNNNSTEFNPFSEEEEYPNSLNPFDDEEYPNSLNPFDDEEYYPSCNNSEICPGASRNHDDEIERLEVNSAPQSFLMAAEVDNNNSNVEVHDNNENDNFYNIENIVEHSGGFASPEGNSKSQSPIMSTEAESNDTKVKILGYIEDALRDLRYLYIPEYELANIDVSESESHLITEEENKSRMINILKEENVPEKFNDEDMSNNKIPVDDKASYSKKNQINQKENTSHCSIKSSSNAEEKNPPIPTSSVSKVSSVQVFKEVCNSISCSPDDEAASINNSITPNHFSASKSMKTSNVPPVVKRKRLKKYKAPAPPVLPKLPSKIESLVVKENENLSKMCVNIEEKEMVKEFNDEKVATEQDKNNYQVNHSSSNSEIHNKKAANNNSSVASSSNANKYSSTTPKSTGLQKGASKNKYRISRPAPAPPVSKPLQPQQETSTNKYRISRPAPAPPVPKPLQLQQEASKNKNRISRPAPPPPVPESLQPIGPVADTMPETKLIATKEYRRKDRRKSLMDLFKVKKKKKKDVDMS